MKTLKLIWSFFIALFTTILPKVHKFLKKLFKKNPELWTIPILGFLWFERSQILHSIAPTASVFDDGVILIPVFAILVFFLYIFISWLAMKVFHSTLTSFLKDSFKSAFKELTPWQKVKLSFFVSLFLFSALIILTLVLRP